MTTITQGSEKQIEWAGRIRADFLTRIDTKLAETEHRVEIGRLPAEKAQKTLAAARGLRDWVAGIESAPVLIDGRASFDALLLAAHHAGIIESSYGQERDWAVAARIR